MFAENNHLEMLFISFATLRLEKKVINEKLGEMFDIC